MNTISPTLEEITQAIEELPQETWPELANFIEQLHEKVEQKPSPVVKPKKKFKGKGMDFLHSIIGLGASQEGDLSERDEEILANEIHPIYGWSLYREEE